MSLKILSLEAQSFTSLCFKPASRCLFFSKMNSRQENRSKFSFYRQIYVWIFFGSFSFYLLCENISKGFLKFCKLISNMHTRSDHCLKSYKRTQTCRISCARLHEFIYKKQTSNTIITQAYLSRCTENYQVRPKSLQTFQPSYASSKVKNENDAIRNRISDFDKRRISQPKTQ